MQIFSAKLTEKNEITKGVFILKFEKPPNFDFKAGQFVQWVFSSEDKKITRSYSMCSIPNDNFIEFCIKLMPNGKASSLVQKIKIGDILKFQEAQGHFVCTEDTKPIFLIATGTGIAPMMSIIRDLLENKKTDKEIHLLFGLRHEEDLFWQNKFDELTKQHPNFSYQLTLSQPNKNWKGLRGRVTSHLEDHPKNHQFFICGNLEMIREVKNLLTKNKVNIKDIHFEIF